MIKLNNTVARQKVKPLHQDQLQYMCESMSQSFSMKPNSMIMGQRFIDSYQNLQHFWDVVGGWDGLNKLQEECEHKVTEAEHSAVGYPYFSSDINVEYEIVKGE